MGCLDASPLNQLVQYAYTRSVGAAYVALGGLLVTHAHSRQTIADADNTTHRSHSICNASRAHRPPRVPFPAPLPSSSHHIPSHRISHPCPRPFTSQTPIKTANWTHPDVRRNAAMPAAPYDYSAPGVGPRPPLGAPVPHGAPPSGPVPPFGVYPALPGAPQAYASPGAYPPPSMLPPGQQGPYGAAMRPTPPGQMPPAGSYGGPAPPQAPHGVGGQRGGHGGY